MTGRDQDEYDGFARGFARIESEVPDGPPFEVVRGAEVAARRRARSLAVVAAGLVVLAIAFALRPATPPLSVGGPVISPSPSEQAAPPVPEPVCGPSPEVGGLRLECEAAVALALDLLEPGHGPVSRIEFAHACSADSTIDAVIDCAIHLSGTVVVEFSGSEPGVTVFVHPDSRGGFTARVIGPHPSPSAPVVAVPSASSCPADRAFGEDLNPVAEALEAYGHRDEYAGMYLDNANLVVRVLWTADAESHGAALRALLPPCHPVAFGSARWTFDELTDWADRIGAEYEWFLEIPAAMRMVGVDVVANRVELEISSAEQDAAAAVLAHFHPPEGLLRITSDGTGAALLPEGDVAGRVLAADGTTPKLDLQLGFAALDNTPGWCLEQVGYGIAENGLIIYRCKTGRRVVTVNARNDRFEYEIVAAAWIDVPADGEVAVELKLPADADRSSLTFHGWTASCGRAASLDCLGAVDRFTNVLGRSHDGVLATSGGRLSVELRPECPQVPVWAAAAECWQVSAEGGTGPICMVIARRADDLRYPPYVQVAGHTPGRPPPPEPWAAC